MTEIERYKLAILQAIMDARDVARASATPRSDFKEIAKQLEAWAVIVRDEERAQVK